MAAWGESELFCQGINVKATSEEVRELFARHGTVKEVVFVGKRDGKSSQVALIRCDTTDLSRKWATYASQTANLPVLLSWMPNSHLMGFHYAGWQVDLMLRLRVKPFTMQISSKGVSP